MAHVKPEGSTRGTRLGFGVAAGLDPAIATELGALCARLGFTSLWSNDHPAASGLETVAALGASAPDLDLGVGALALDRHAPAEVAAKLAEVGIGPELLWLAIGAGFSRRPLQVVRQGVAELRVALPDGVRLAVAAMGPKMCSLAGEVADGVFLNWMTPDRAQWARERVADGAARAGREIPLILGYLRVAVGEDAERRLVKEESFYRSLHRGYERHFAALGAELGTVGIAATTPVDVSQRMAAYAGSMDEIVLRALAHASTEAMGAVARAAQALTATA